MTGSGARSELAKWSVVMPGLSLGNLPSFVICAVRAAVDLAEAPDSLAAARAKGRQFAEREYDSADNLTLLDAQAYAGRNAVVINDERERGKL